jgi:hypothetical protein
MYDDAEALEIIAQAVEELSPDLNRRETAGRELVKAVAEAAQKAGCAVEPVLGDGLTVALPRIGAVQVASPEFGKVLVRPLPNGRAAEIRLRFNRLSGLLEGDDLDSFRAPAPGSPRLRRSGLAVVMEAVAAGLRESASNRGR